MNDHAKALRDAFLRKQMKFRRLTMIVRRLGDLYRRLNAERMPSKPDNMRFQLVRDSGGLMLVNVQRLQ